MAKRLCAFDHKEVQQEILIPTYQFLPVLPMTTSSCCYLFCTHNGQLYGTHSRAEPLTVQLVLSRLEKGDSGMVAVLGSIESQVEGEAGVE